MNYSIYSIDTKYLLKTILYILDFKQLCKNCKRIAIPPDRSY